MNKWYDGDGKVCWYSRNGGADIFGRVRSNGDGGGCIGVSSNI